MSLHSGDWVSEEESRVPKWMFRLGSFFRRWKGAFSSDSSDSDEESLPIPLQTVYPEERGRCVSIVPVSPEERGECAGSRIVKMTEIEDGRCYPIEPHTRNWNPRYVRANRSFFFAGKNMPRRVITHPDEYPAPSDGVLYGWVDPEPLGIVSILTRPELQEVANELFPTPGDEAGTSYEIYRAGHDERICTRMGNRVGFYFYEELVMSLGIRMPFTDFEISLLARLRVAPSQLHPQAWAFARAYQKYCAAYHLACTVNCFLFMYRPQITYPEAGATRRVWASVRSYTDTGLFLRYSDSFKRFKRKYFRYNYCGTGRAWFVGDLGPKFPLSWNQSHFTHYDDFKKWVPPVDALTAEEKATINHFRVRLRTDGPIDIRRFINADDGCVADIIGT